jgi:hypothetical protein
MFLVPRILRGMGKEVSSQRFESIYHTATFNTKMFRKEVPHWHIDAFYFWHNDYTVFHQPVTTEASNELYRGANGAFSK